MTTPTEIRSITIFPTVCKFDAVLSICPTPWLPLSKLAGNESPQPAMPPLTTSANPAKAYVPAMAFSANPATNAIEPVAAIHASSMLAIPPIITMEERKITYLGACASQGLSSTSDSILV